MLEYARWKYILVGVVLLLALIVASPVLFGEDPALQLARKNREPVTGQVQAQIESFLKENGTQFARTYIDNGNLMIRFPNVGEQLKARDLINQRFSREYATALSFAPRTPELMRAIGLHPMRLGLDLRGGLYLLYQVDMNAAMEQLLENYAVDMQRALTQAKIPFTDAQPIAVDGSMFNAVRIRLPQGADVEAARSVLTKAMPDLTFTTQEQSQGSVIQAVLTR
ncbi:MAG TPA: hypothetical protein VIL32_04255, partial [Steroidobacteraceae bacterium]